MVRFTLHCLYTKNAIEIIKYVKIHKLDSMAQGKTKGSEKDGKSSIMNRNRKFNDSAGHAT